MEQLAKSRPSLLGGGIPGYHLELGCKIVDEGDRVSTGLGRYRRCECSGERDHGSAPAYGKELIVVARLA